MTSNLESKMLDGDQNAEGSFKSLLEALVLDLFSQPFLLPIFLSKMRLELETGVVKGLFAPFHSKYFFGAWIFSPLN